MMTREPTREPPGQPMLPFEEAAPARRRDEATEQEIEPCGVWRTLPAAMRVEVRRGCLRAMREVIGDDRDK